MGEYQIEELALKKDDKDNILHPRYTHSGIPPVDTFHSVVQGRVGSRHDTIQQWCHVKAWFGGGIASPCPNMSEEAVQAWTKAEVC